MMKYIFLSRAVETLKTSLQFDVRYIVLKLFTTDRKMLLTDKRISAYLSQRTSLLKPLRLFNLITSDIRDYEVCVKVQSAL